VVSSFRLNKEEATMAVRSAARSTAVSAALIALSLSTLVLMPGCPFGESTKPKEQPTPPPVLPRTPTEVLQHLERAYESMDSTAYAALLDPEFAFHFDPRDIGEPTGYRDSWPRADDLQSTRRMFRGAPSSDEKRLRALNVELNFNVGETDTVAGQPGWKMIIASNTELQVDARSLVNGEDWCLQTPGGYESWLYLRERAAAGDSGTYWTIVRWVDKPPASSKTETSTWGSIKALFH